VFASYGQLQGYQPDNLHAPSLAAKPAGCLKLVVQVDHGRHVKLHQSQHYVGHLPRVHVG
jgi:hypothetical protein